jgi:hypothetical protein
VVKSWAAPNNLLRRITENKRNLAKPNERLFCGVIALFPTFEFKSIPMKKIVLISLLSLAATSIKAQKVFSVKYESQADVKVFVVKYESQADLKVYKVKYESQAGNNDGKWFFTDYESQAKKKIFFVDYESQADIKIFFVDYESQVGWKNSAKKQLLY